MRPVTPAKEERAPNDGAQFEQLASVHGSPSLARAPNPGRPDPVASLGRPAVTCL